MRKIRTIGIFFTLIAVVFSGLPARATDWVYKEGPKYGWFERLTLYYEVEQDYSIDLSEYFADDNKDQLPPALNDTYDVFDLLIMAEILGINVPDYGPQPLGWKKTDEQIQALQNHIAWLKTQSIKWDFIELEAGILTVKKGYRWDGASTIGNDCDISKNDEYYIRGSCLHDSIYDLMRLGYIDHDRLGNDNYSDDGFLNRLMADCLMYMIFREDEDKKFKFEFKLVRYGGAQNTLNQATNMCGDPLLATWKFHVSELTAWASDEGIELRFLPADAALRDPTEYGNASHVYKISRIEDPAGNDEGKTIAIITDDENLGAENYYDEDWDVFYTDRDIESGKFYSYQVERLYGETSTDINYRYYDESNVESVATPNGRGNALYLNCIMGMTGNFVTADLVSNDLSGSSITFEAWVYPEAQDAISSILAFNTSSGGNYNLLMYDGNNKQFCYYDDNNTIPGAQVDPGRWYHVAVTINGSNEGVLYVNGTEQATFSTDIRPSKTALFSMGQDWDNDLTPTDFFKGRIDEVRIWTVARTQFQIQDGMSYAMRGDETGLVGLWHFDEQSGWGIYDATPNGNDGAPMLYNESLQSVGQGLAIRFPSKAMWFFVDPDSELKAYYPFDMNAWDQSGNSNDGTVQGATLTEDRFGDAENAYDFDGVNDYISLADILDFGEGSSTVACWVKIPVGVTGRVGILLGNYPQTPNANFEIYDDGQLRIYWNNGELDLYGTKDLTDGLWHHIAFVRDKEENNRFYAYIDGVQETLSSHDSAGTDLEFAIAHRIGADLRGGGTPYFSGVMDDLRVYGRALTIDEIFNLADSDDDGLPDRWEKDNYLDPSDIDTDDNSIADGAEDPDGDGINNLGEYNADTEPNDADSDDDGLPDDWELNNGLGPLTADGDGDPDGDGLNNLGEYNAGTDPNDADTDDDGLTDGQEVNTYATNPNDEDSDDDGLTDYEEVNTYSTNPNNKDTDDDGLTDYEEVNTYSTDPDDADTDDDGLPDDWELNNGLDPLTADGDGDPDGDGLSNSGEYNAGTDPDDADTDDDGLTDGQEVNTYATNPNDADTDDDSLTDGQEANTYATYPNDEDSDDDEYSDGQEVLHDSDPGDFSDTPESMVVYVKEFNEGTINGKSWGTAFIDLQKAIELSISGDEIWVAKGTYYPSKAHGGIEEQYKSFRMKNNLSIYGGFAGDETARDQRDIQANQTSLSGDIGTVDNYSDNSYHVFYHPEGTDLDATAVLDGFTITGGYASSNSLHGRGGGMYNHSSSPTLTNCIFNGNSGRYGGGMYNYSSSPTLTDCIFSGNESFSDGGGMYNCAFSTLTIENCTFRRNYAGNFGGGIYNFSSSPTLTNCTFSINYATYGGGGMYNMVGELETETSSPNMTNCTFSGNEAYASYGRGGGMVNYSSSPTMTNCIFSSNFANYWGGGMYNYAISSPTLESCTFSGNYADYGGGMYNDNDDSFSPTLTNCIMWGNAANIDGNEIHNVSGSSILKYSNIEGCGGSGDSWEPDLGTDNGNNMDSDPLFIRNPEAEEFNYGDLHLCADSPCIDTGDPSITDGTDIDGEMRIFNSVIDMGVDEFVDIDGDGISDIADSDNDNDGISDEMENAHPNGGDGNNDTIPDRLQNNVASLLSHNGQDYVTLTSPAGTGLKNCQAAGNPSPEDAPAGIGFLYGFFNFTITGIGLGDGTTLTLYFPVDAVLEIYYNYGQTPDNQTEHWYEFLYDDETGAQIDDINKIITLHFADAKRGDDILTQDSMVITIGGPGAPYNEIINVYKNELESQNPMPFADLDPNFPPEGDFDGDRFSNYDEVLFYSSNPLYATFPIFLPEGINLFYFPSIDEPPNIVSNGQFEVYYYDTETKLWDEDELFGFMKSNTFNAIYTTQPGILYLDLREFTRPILCLKGFLNPGYTPQTPNPLDYLNIDFFDPNHFNPDKSTFTILNDPNIIEIQTINSKTFQNGLWRSSYRFFGKPAGEDLHFSPYEIYFVTNLN